MDAFAGIVGQQKAVSFLQTVLQQGSPVHAYLFVGPPGIGKTRAATAFACSLLEAGAAAGGRTWERENHPDLFVAGKTGSKVSITEVRRLEEWLAYHPYLSSYRVALFPDAHLLSMEAANALLKTLEEPPAYAVIVLISDEADVLPTVRSRCQEVKFNPLPVPLLEQTLLQEGTDLVRAGLAARLARGSLKRARLFADFPELGESLFHGRDFLLEMARGGELILLRKAQELEKDEIKRVLFFSIMEVLLRDIAVYHETKDQRMLVFPENMNLATELPVKVERVKRVLQEMSGLLVLLGRNINPLLINLNILFQIRRAVKEE
ncbi:MAG TPA: hypothetical protein GXX39_06135 [Syntrophothermus lipocalidus]|uniref:DNA polymerase III, delta prime subunit n=1 Tax=Syntrophothermus lipocalidus (strain DSM 12680 / TGB-C1) TaxID=643648 RepID=D7CIJ0_SYNLT|nr:DNA polymerase III subunit delta' [Syntrophothermus lipocalidus]ADI00855.1 DNA polymerase III, delta prime subunit [Syntrophothermus lipocalidus DSM 12680]HHV76925.1 hypothetical protein [Syntrophothermus lipocalidus]